MANVTTTSDLISRWRPLTSDELTKATILIGDYEAELHIYASNRGYDLDEMLDDDNFERVFVAVVCSAVAEQMSSTEDGPAMSQFSQSALGYSVSGTYLNPGGGLFIRNNLLKQLGLLKQKIKAVNLYDVNDTN